MPYLGIQQFRHCDVIGGDDSDGSGNPPSDW